MCSNDLGLVKVIAMFSFSINMQPSDRWANFKQLYWAKNTILKYKIA